MPVTAAPLGLWAPLTVVEVVDLLDGVDGLWWLSGGQAIDHWLGAVTRPHGDTDVSVATQDWPRILTHVRKHLHISVAYRGSLSPLPAVPLPEHVHNLWAATERHAPWCLQLNLEPVHGNRWVYRRDGRVTRPLFETVLDVRGVPTVAPAVQLLWKSQAPGPRDEHDRQQVAAFLGRDETRWLNTAIATAHPSSPWAGSAPT